MYTIKQIAEKINNLSVNYEIGRLQEIRKSIKNLSRKASSTIFNNETISEDGWAFHYGGRKELQFNIGYEDEGVRYGIALSLETSRTLPSIEILYPKLLRLNSLIANEPELFADYKMWFWQGGKRSEITNVFEIDESLTKNGTFIFVGKIMSINEIDFNEILETFDNLLKIYIDVENESNTGIAEIDSETAQDNFIFRSGKANLPQKTNYNRIQQQINVDARHSFLQEKLYKKLVFAFGEKNVGLENPINGKKIDLVLKTKDFFTFYEIKTANSAKQCIREAFGQILEYTYFEGKKYADKIVIAGEYPIDKKTKNYLKFLNSEFDLPISYHQIDINF